MEKDEGGISSLLTRSNSIASTSLLVRGHRTFIAPFSVDIESSVVLSHESMKRAVRTRIKIKKSIKKANRNMKKAFGIARAI